LDKAEIVKRATALLTDIENDTLAIELLIAKALSLARLAADDDAIEWLSYEMTGYNIRTAVGGRYAILTSRWDGQSDKGYLGPAASIAHTVATMTQTLDVHKQLQPSGEYMMVQQNDKAKKVHEWSSAIEPLARVVSSVKAQLYLFGSRVLEAALFSDTSKSIFERYQSSVDRHLAQKASKAFEKLPHVFERLREGDTEAISHALTSCRRIIDSFADSVFPAQAEPFTVNGQELDVTAPKTKNRVRAFLSGKITSTSRRDRMNKNLGALYDRVSAGVHSDVTTDEAQALVLNTYLLLGEIVSLP
jgi:hypothetical protein